MKQGVDIHAPTLELARGVRVVRARRQIVQSGNGWPLTDDGVATLRGKDVTSYRSL